MKASSSPTCSLRFQSKVWVGAVLCFAALCLGTLASVHAQVTVFNDTFGAGSTINSNPVSPAAPTIDKTAYEQISAKAFQTTSASLGHMKFGLPGTTFATTMVEALFTQYSVALINTNDTIQLTVIFTPQAAMLDFSGSGLGFGLYSSGTNGTQVQPLPGGQANSTAAVAGYAQNWVGYATRIMIDSGSGIFTRPVQSATASSNQDVTLGYASSTQLTTPATPTIFLSATTQYTAVYSITKTDTNTLQFSTNLYQGAGAGGSNLFTHTGTAPGILTGTFDALAFGFRATGASGATHTQIVDVNNIKVVTTGSTTIVPVITQQPLSQTKSLGESVTLTVVSTGGGAPLTYQWKKGGADIGNATSASYSIPNISQSDAGNYTVVVTDAAGSTTSDVAALTVSAGAVAPSILSHPSNATILVGGSTTFNAQASGTEPITYQWQRKLNGSSRFTDIPGANSLSYTMTNVQLSGAGLYQLVATNAQGYATSNPATLTVQQPAFIITEPVGAALNPGVGYTLVSAGGGIPAPSYQWIRNGTVIAGATNATLPLNSVSGAATGNYTVVVTNQTVNSIGTIVTNSVTSSVASIAVVSPSLTATFTSNGSKNISPDAPLTINFNQPILPGVSGNITIAEVSGTTSQPVEIIDMVAATSAMNSLRSSGTLSVLALPIQKKKIGGVTNFNYYPVVTNPTAVIGGSFNVLSGTSANIYPRNYDPSYNPADATQQIVGLTGSTTGITYGKTYQITIDPGVFVDANGLCLPGVSSTNPWTFSTKASMATSGTLTVAADGTGDFNTVQGAVDSIPAGNTTPRTIYIRKGNYFEIVFYSGKNSLTFQGEDRKQSFLVYPNNNTLNNVSGLYHRMTFHANGATDTVIRNLTIKNATPQTGGQAEALILNGGATTARSIVSAVDLYGYQDTWQSTGQAYGQDLYIEGDVDFMWGGGPAFFKNSTFKMMRTTGGYYAQVRNPSTNHGFVYSNCTFTAGTGASAHFLNRIDPGVFPYSEVVVLNCKVGSGILNSSIAASGADYNDAWWKMNNATPTTSATNIHFWDYNTSDQNGNTLLNTGTAGASYVKTLTSPADDITIANYNSPDYVLGGSWTPQLTPLIVTQPSNLTVNLGQSGTFSVVASGVPDPTYQWYKNDVAITGATNSTYSIASAAGVDYGSYKVTVTNSAGSVTSNVVALSFTDPEANFAASYGLDPATNGAATADPDHDGMNNKQEFFLGGNPTKSDNSQILPFVTKSTVNGSPAIIFEFSRRKAAAGIAYTVEYSTDLSNWTTAVNGQNNVTFVTTPSPDPNTDHITVTIPSSNVRAFVRLRM